MLTIPRTLKELGFRAKVTKEGTRSVKIYQDEVLTEDPARSIELYVKCNPKWCITV